MSQSGEAEDMSASRTLCMPIAQCRVAHVSELDVALGARVHENIALCWVKLGSRDNLCELLHVHRLDVDDVCDMSAHRYVHT